MTTTNPRDERVLILAPTGRDAAIAQDTLRHAGLVAETCASIDDLCREIDSGVGALLVTQEALTVRVVTQLLDKIDDQPLWSDLPLVALLSGGAATPITTRLSSMLGARANVTFLERPVRSTTLVSAIQFALRARRRQYELREHLLARTEAETAERQARALAESAVRIRDEFLASVAHDLKNPLGTIRGYAQLLHRQTRAPDTPAQSQVAQGLTKIDMMVGKMLDQIDELLDLARLQAKQPLPLNLEPTDLVRLAGRVQEDYQQTTHLHCIRIDAACSELVGVWDRSRLERVLGNLLANAIKYSPDGGEITIEVKPEPSDQIQAAVLRVRDQGIGIAPEDLPHVFERFYRGSNTREIVPGTGLGLTGARQIIEQHGGLITVTSTAGEGSTFTVRLPVVQNDGLTWRTTPQDVA
jgi:two-component system, sensor histidine kinase